MTDMKTPLMISFFGPSGSGKSTCRLIAEAYLRDKGYLTHSLNVAYPLRCIQAYAYDLFELGKQDPSDEDFRQDGKLLGFLAQHFESHLGPMMSKRLDLVRPHIGEDDLVAFINTDCRNNAYKDLKDEGFLFIKLDVFPDILNRRRRSRGDLTPFDYQSSVEAYDQIVAGYVLPNNGTIDSLTEKIQKILDDLLSKDL